MAGMQIPVAESDSLLLLALEQSIMAVVLIDENDHVLFFNQAAEQLWGYSRHEVLGRHMEPLLPQALRAVHCGYTDRHRKGGEARVAGMSRELLLERKDGRQLWVVFSLSRIDAGDGRIHYMAIVRDVSADVANREYNRLLLLAVNHTDQAVLSWARQRCPQLVHAVVPVLPADTELLAAGHAGLSMAFLQDMLDALPYGVLWVSLPDGQFRHANAAFRLLFGYSSGLAGTMDQLLADSCIHEHQHELLRQHWQKLARQPGGRVTALPDTEIDILTGDSQIRTVLHCGLFLHSQQLAVFFFRDISDFKGDHQVLREFANLDPLTGLANRRGLKEWWLRETRSKPSLVLLMIDLDGFKPVNDTFGHIAGDEVLCIVARRLQAVVREGELVCRLGGDEFGILLFAPPEAGLITRICERLISVLHEPVMFNGTEIHLSGSIGGCRYPEQAADLRELLQYADRALYQVKKTGKGNWAWYCP